MNTGIILNARVGQFTIRRAPYVSVHSQMCQLSVTHMHVHDEAYGIYQGLSIGDIATITHGYLADTQSTVKGVVASKDTIDTNLISIRMLGAEDYALATTFIKESYNDELPSVIVRNLLSVAGVGMGELALPDEPIPHIIFGNISIWAAMAQLKQMVTRLYGTENTYYICGGKFYWDTKPIGKPIKADISNIIKHKVSNTGRNQLELSLAPDIQISDQIDITDNYRGVRGAYRIESVEHVYKDGSIRTYVEYVEGK